VWNSSDEVYCPKPVVQPAHVTDEIFSYIAEIWQILINYYFYNNSWLYVLLYVYLCLQVHVLLSVWFSNEYCIVHCPKPVIQPAHVTDEIFSYIAEIWQILINYYFYNNSRLYVLLYVYLCLQLIFEWIPHLLCGMGPQHINKKIKTFDEKRVETVSLRI
jgi:hypothetical protein